MGPLVYAISWGPMGPPVYCLYVASDVYTLYIVKYSEVQPCFLHTSICHYLPEADAAASSTLMVPIYTRWPHGASDTYAYCNPFGEKPNSRSELHINAKRVGGFVFKLSRQQASDKCIRNLRPREAETASHPHSQDRPSTNGA